MPAYLIVYRETPITDADAIARYSASNRAHAALFQAQYHAEPLVIYGQSEAPEGANPDGVTMLKFPTYADAKAFYESAEYQSAIPDRQLAAEWRVVIVEGLG